MDKEEWIEMMEKLQDIRQFSCLYIRRSKKGGIASAQELDALSRLMLSGERLTPYALCSLMGISKSLGSRLIESLEGKGFVEKEASNEDKRSYYLGLTKAGSKELNDTYTYYLEPVYALKKRLGTENFLQMTALIRESIQVPADEEEKNRREGQ